MSQVLIINTHVRTKRAHARIKLHHAAHSFFALRANTVQNKIIYKYMLLLLSHPN